MQIQQAEVYAQVEDQEIVPLTKLWIFCTEKFSLGLETRGQRPMSLESTTSTSWADKH